MSVALSPVSPRAVSVGASVDPYKKYWGAILAGFVLTGLWLCLPIMGPQIGSTRVAVGTQASAGGEGSLDAAPIPSNGGPGAPGAPLDLSKDAAAPSGGVDATSMLYQAPSGGEPLLLHDGAPLGSAAGSATSASLAQQLKAIGKSKGGWGGQTPQRGFEVPSLHLGGGLSGLGSVSGGSGASAFSDGGGGAFGTSNAAVGRAATVGLTTGADEKAAAGGLSALKSAAAQAQLAAARRSGDASVNALNHVFDGSRQRQSSIGLAGSPGGAYTAMDQAAPINLKQLVNPNVDQKKYTPPPPATPAPPSADGQTAAQIGMMLASTLLGGILGGQAGQMVMMAGMMLMQQQQQAAQAREQACMNQVQTTGKSSGC
jgi:hypothetical protein